MPGELRKEFLKILVEQMSPDQMLLLEAFGLKYLGGDLPTWFYSVWPSVQTVTPFKTCMRDTIRHIGIRNPLVKALQRRQFNRTSLILWGRAADHVKRGGG